MPTAEVYDKEKYQGSTPSERNIEYTHLRGVRFSMRTFASCA